MSAPGESQAISSPLRRRGRGRVAAAEGRGHAHAHTSGWASAALSLGALGVVYGDIGTSPLYTVQQIFSGDHRMRSTPSHVYGAISLIFWALMMMVIAQVRALILRADNHGEGGIMALVALIQRSVKSHRKTAARLIVGILGASLFYGDGDADAGDLGALGCRRPGGRRRRRWPHVVPLAVRDPGRAVFGAAVWDRRGRRAVRPGHGAVVRGDRRAGAGTRSWRNPGSCGRCDPTYARAFLAATRGLGFLALGSVFLAVTGAEALYADMGHFGERRSARLVRAGAARPGAELLRSGRLLLADPMRSQNPFYLLAPGWALYLRWWCSPPRPP